MRVPETGEYKVVWKQNGRVVESKCYYTDDLEDARDTFVAILIEAQRHGYNVRIRDDKWVPELFRDLVGK